MTALDERQAQAATGVPRCSVMVDVLGLLGLAKLTAPPARPILKCGFPAAGYWAGECPCGHVRDGWLCEVHAETAGKGGCRACLELEDGPHECPLPLSRVNPGGMP